MTAKEMPRPAEAGAPNETITNHYEDDHLHFNNSDRLGQETQRVAAHELHAQLGLCVFPVDHPDQPECVGLHGPNHPCDGQRGKHPAVKWGTWAIAATPQMIDVAWDKLGGIANIGVSCGPSNLVVFDEDAHGELAKWSVTHGVTLPPTYTVTTGRGKHHYYFWDHKTQGRIGNVPKIVAGFKLDIRGDGGFVVAESSQHHSGAVYTGNGQPIELLPSEVADLLLGEATKKQGGAENGCGVNSEVQTIWESDGKARNPDEDRISFHERHSSLVAYAGRLRNKGLDYREAETLYKKRWQLCEQPLGQIPEARYHSTPPAECNYPVTWEDARGKLRDVYGRYPAGMTADENPAVAHAVGDRTDSGNTDILAATYRKNLRYCPDIAKWFAWDENRWQHTPDDAHAYLAARTVADNLPKGGLDEKGKPDAAAKHFTRSRNRGGLDAMVALARRHPELQVLLHALDNNRYELNTPDGIINLRTGELSSSSPTKWHTKITGSGYNPDIPPAEFLKFLDTTFDGDEEVIDYIQAVAGITAIGEVLEHILPFCFGSGANGKTVLLDILIAVLGDYAIVSPGTFLLAGRDKHETEIARLHGARLVVCSELNADSKFDEAKAKALTGGDKLTGRYMHKDFFDFVPSHTLWLAGNNQPDVPAGGTSFWRRLRLIPFQNTVPEEERIENLAVKLVDSEGPAIMAWMVAGAVRYLRDGISTPQEVLNETEEYADATRSGVARFIQEVCTLGTGNMCRANSVYQSYLTWAAANKEPLITIQKFGLDIKAAGVTGRKTKDGKSYDITVHTDRLPPTQQTKMGW